jgi:hypothetical protein
MHRKRGDGHKGSRTVFSQLERATLDKRVIEHEYGNEGLPHNYVYNRTRESFKLFFLKLLNFKVKTKVLMNSPSKRERVINIYHTTNENMKTLHFFHFYMQQTLSSPVSVTPD